MENETEIDLDAEIASLRKATDEHETRLQNLHDFMKTVIDSEEQRIKLFERILERLDSLERRHNELANVVTGSILS